VPTRLKMRSRNGLRLGTSQLVARGGGFHWTRAKRGADWGKSLRFSLSHSQRPPYQGNHNGKELRHNTFCGLDLSSVVHLVSEAQDLGLGT
jgi:hypothetical protein